MTFIKQCTPNALFFILGGNMRKRNAVAGENDNIVKNKIVNKKNKINKKIKNK